MKIYVAGHKGLVGSTIIKQLILNGVDPSSIIVRTHQELDLTNQQDTNEFFKKEKPDQVYFAAAKVGGVHSNNEYPAEFIYKNLMIQTNTINAAYKNGVNKLLMIGSTCVYPKLAQNPITEDMIMTGALEPTNEPYAVAKIAAMKMCESYNRQYGTDYRTVLPCNLFGPGDNYHPENGHVTAGIINTLHQAKLKDADSAKIWGTGTPRREFLYSDDMADGCIHVMNVTKEQYDSVTSPMQSYVNLTAGYDMPIREWAEMIKEVVGFEGKLEFDTNRPDGALNKLTDNSKVTSLGWKPKVDLKVGLKRAYEWYIYNCNR